MKKRMRQIKKYWDNSTDKKQVGIVLSIVIILVLVILIPLSLAALEPTKSVIITSRNTSYENKEAGSWQIKKSGKWSEPGYAEISFDVSTVRKTKYQYTDIILVLDTSGSMEGEKITRLKEDTNELLDTLLENKENKAAVIQFDTNSSIITGLTSDKETLTNAVNSLTPNDTTNYYKAFLNVEEILKEYKQEKDRKCIVLFLTDGYPNEGMPNEKVQYRILKSLYPFITINGIQYEMGEEIKDEIKSVSDFQYVADRDNLDNALVKASIAPVIYDNFEITDFVESEYFTIEKQSDIEVSDGKVTLDKEKQMINWKIDQFKSGQEAKMKIRAKLKPEYFSQGGIYPTNKKEIIKSKIDDQEENIDSTKTPVLADNYKVIYDGNAPEDCRVSGVPREENKSVFELVNISEEVPVCEGYQFKGWVIASKNVKRMDHERFYMPEDDVVLKATWGKVSIKKSMTGEVYTVQTFYKMMQNDAVPDDIKSEFVSSTSGINFKNAPSDTNGKGVYIHAPTKNEEFPVLYYRGAVENNNVKFGGFCWKIVRTTETGGVKMIYNGTPDDAGGCTNTTGNATQIGTSVFNSSYNSTSPADVGYMYGTRYTYDLRSIPSWYSHIGRSTSRNNILSQTSMSSSTKYYYGDSIRWDEGTGTYILENSDGSEVIATEWSEVKNYVKGKYTCLWNGTSCSSVSYIADASGSYLYTLTLKNNETLENVDKTWNYGKEVVYENGVYTIQNPSTFKSSEWYSKGSSVTRSYMCLDGGVSCSNIQYVDSSSDSYTYYVEMSNGETYESLLQEGKNKKWIYGNDVERDGSKYILKDTYESSPLDWSSDYKTIATKYHYSCFSTENNCTQVGYIHYFSNSSSIYHLKLSGGKNIEDAKSEMFTNTNDSKIKQTIDTWYQANMVDYTDRLEDTIWCNDRSIYNGPLKSKDEDSSTNDYTKFGARGRNLELYQPSLKCSNKRDQFTVSEENGNGALTYPVALLTADELTLAGHGWNQYSSSSYLYTNKWWWALSPSNFYDDYANGFYVSSSGDLNDTYVSSANGVRPAVSLAPGTIVGGGDGSMNDPFTVDLEQ